MPRHLKGAALVVGATACVVLLVAAGTFAASRPPLISYLVQGHDAPGFAPSAKPLVYTTAAEWGAALGPKSTAEPRLAKEGFVEALTQSITYSADPTSGAGVSWVVEVGSAADATREAAADLTRLEVGGDGASVTKRYSLKGIPGSHAWIDQAPVEENFYSANTILTEGSCVLLIGVERSAGGSLSNVMGPIQSAATSILRRTHKRCP
jgi:hypothetical protein